MAEDHRRVEARQIVGTGMATDAERITTITDEAARRERAWRNAPEVAFGDVLVQTPARGADLDDEHERAGAGAAAASDDATNAESTPTSSASPSSSPQQKPPARAPLRAALRAPDPRARLLHAQIAARPSKPPTSTSSSAPPRPARPGPRE